MSIHPELKISQLFLKYGQTSVLKNISGTFEAQSLTAIIGPNGGGKSTLLKAIMGFLSPTKGSVKNTFSRVAYLPQRSEIDLTFPLSAQEAVAMGLWFQKGPFKSYAQSDLICIQAALYQVGMEHFAKAQLNTLSGGQLQRVLFSRLLLQDADLIVLDEPFTGIDTRTTKDLLTLIQAWHEAGKTIIAVLHDLEIVRNFFPQCLLLAHQVIGWGETSQVLTSENLLNFHVCSHPEEEI